MKTVTARVTHKEEPRYIISNKSPILGADPEFFITTKRGKTLSACQFLPSKFNKTGVLSKSGIEIGKFFFDGVQGEMNVTPSSCREILAIRIWQVLKNIKGEIGANNKLVMKPSVVVDRNILDNADPEARRFGCSPDWNAYTGLQNESSLDGNTHRVRYGGGHVHLSFCKKDRMLDDPQIFLDFVKLLDLIVGIPMLLLDIGPASNRRRKYYGKAGTFRETRWGLEYRQVSNIWLKSPELTSLVLGLTRTAYRIMISGAEDCLWKLVKPEEVRKAIDTSNLTDCMEIYEKVRTSIIHVSLSDDPFYKRHSRYIENKTVFIAGSDIYDYVVAKTANVVYGADCEKAWHIDPTSTSERMNCPNRIYRGFIDGTLDIVRKTSEEDFRKLIGLKD